MGRSCPLRRRMAASVNPRRLACMYMSVQSAPEASANALYLLTDGITAVVTGAERVDDSRILLTGAAGAETDVVLESGKKVTIRHDEIEQYATSRSGERVSALLQREGVSVGPLEMDTSVRTARKNGTRLNLSPTEYELLYYFMSNPGRFITFDEIYQAVWQRPSIGDVRALFVHVSHLRQKIEDDPLKPAFIRTHLRDGYIFSDGSASDSQGS